ncbi:MAG: hypothetical protein QXR03_02565 [Candidatus Aenigmatarchaeota archaeon]
MRIEANEILVLDIKKMLENTLGSKCVAYMSDITFPWEKNFRYTKNRKWEIYPIMRGPIFSIYETFEDIIYIESNLLFNEKEIISNIALMEIKEESKSEAIKELKSKIYENLIDFIHGKAVKIIEDFSKRENVDISLISEYLGDSIVLKFDSRNLSINEKFSLINKYVSILINVWNEIMGADDSLCRKAYEFSLPIEMNKDFTSLLKKIKSILEKNVRIKFLIKKESFTLFSIVPFSEDSFISSIDISPKDIIIRSKAIYSFWNAMHYYTIYKSSQKFIENIEKRMRWKQFNDSLWRILNIKEKEELDSFSDIMPEVMNDIKQLNELIGKINRKYDVKLDIEIARILIKFIGKIEIQELKEDRIIPMIEKYINAIKDAYDSSLELKNIKEIEKYAKEILKERIKKEEYLF